MPAAPSPPRPAQPLLPTPSTPILSTASPTADGNSTLRDIDPPYIYNTRDTRREVQARAETYTQLMVAEGLDSDSACAWPSWQSFLRAEEPHRHEEDNSAVQIDHTFSHGGLGG